MGAHNGKHRTYNVQEGFGTLPYTPALLQAPENFRDPPAFVRNNPLYEASSDWRQHTIDGLVNVREEKEDMDLCPPADHLYDKNGHFPDERASVTAFVDVQEETTGDEASVGGSVADLDIAAVSSSKTVEVPVPAPRKTPALLTDSASASQAVASKQKPVRVAVKWSDQESAHRQNFGQESQECSDQHMISNTSSENSTPRTAWSANKKLHGNVSGTHTSITREVVTNSFAPSTGEKTIREATKDSGPLEGFTREQLFLTCVGNSPLVANGRVVKWEAKGPLMIMTDATVEKGFVTRYTTLHDQTLSGVDFRVNLRGATIELDPSDREQRIVRITSVDSRPTLLKFDSSEICRLWLRRMKHSIMTDDKKLDNEHLDNKTQFESQQSALAETRAKSSISTSASTTLIKLEDDPKPMGAMENVACGRVLFHDVSTSTQEISTDRKIAKQTLNHSKVGVDMKSCPNKLSATRPSQPGIQITEVSEDSGRHLCHQNAHTQTEHHKDTALCKSTAEATCLPDGFSRQIRHTAAMFEQLAVAKIWRLLTGAGGGQLLTSSCSMDSLLPRQTTTGNNNHHNPSATEPADCHSSVSSEELAELVRCAASDGDEEDLLWLKVKTRIAQRRRRFQQLDNQLESQRITKIRSQVEGLDLGSTWSAPKRHDEAVAEKAVEIDLVGEEDGRYRCWTGRYIEQDEEQQILKNVVNCKLVQQRLQLKIKARKRLQQSISEENCVAASIAQQVDETRSRLQECKTKLTQDSAWNRKRLESVLNQQEIELTEARAHLDSMRDKLKHFDAEILSHQRCLQSMSLQDKTSACLGRDVTADFSVQVSVNE